MSGGREIPQLTAAEVLRVAQSECLQALSLIESGYTGWAIEPMQRAKDTLNIAERLLNDPESGVTWRPVEQAEGATLRRVLG